MPSDGFFSFEVLVGGLAIPEYDKDGDLYVESNLYTQVSYEQEAREYVDGTLECQDWPVTPYEVSVTLKDGTPDSWVYLNIDGVRVGKKVVKTGGSYVFKGFEDPSTREVKEFLFSLPRFSREKEESISASRASDVGSIEVELCDAIFVRTERCLPETFPHFLQASKKDCKSVTRGKFTMGTTKRGRVLSPATCERGSLQTFSIYDTGKARSSLKVHYRMAHTLQIMGIEVKNYTKAKKKRTALSFF